MNNVKNSKNIKKVENNKDKKMTEKENDIDSEEGRYYDPELLDSGCPHNSDCNNCSAFIDGICTLSFKEYDGDHLDSLLD